MFKDKIKIFFKNLFKLCKIFVKLCIRKIQYCLKILIITISKYLLLIIQLICLFLLIYNGIDLTSDYLSFDYDYKLEVMDNDVDYNLPPISVCTENNVFFDKQKVLNYFDIRKEYSVYVKVILEEYEIIIKSIDNQIKISKNQLRISKEMLTKANFYDEKFNYLEYQTDVIIGTIEKLNTDKIIPTLEKNYNLSQYFVEFNRNIFDKLNFYEMMALLIRAEELFECSMKIHFLNQSFVSKDNCFEISETTEYRSV